MKAEIFVKVKYSLTNDDYNFTAWHGEIVLPCTQEFRERMLAYFIFNDIGDYADHSTEEQRQDYRVLLDLVKSLAKMRDYSRVDIEFVE